jgi:hypothetical protein
MVRRLAAGGRRIRTIGPAKVAIAAFTFSTRRRTGFARSLGELLNATARRSARPSILRIWSAGMPPVPNHSSNLAGLVRASTRILITAPSTSCAARRRPARDPHRRSDSYLWMAAIGTTRNCAGDRALDYGCPCRSNERREPYDLFASAVGGVLQGVMLMVQGFFGKAAPLQAHPGLLPGSG